MSNAGGDTNIAGGIRLAANQVFNTGNGDRPNVQDIMIVVTDGNPNIEADFVRCFFYMFESTIIHVLD